MFWVQFLLEKKQVLWQFQPRLAYEKAVRMSLVFFRLFTHGLFFERLASMGLDNMDFTQFVHIILKFVSELHLNI